MQLECFICDVELEGYNSLLWEKINKWCVKFRSSHQMGQISQIPAIASSRKAYKASGKDPARYRLSAEALSRRVIKGIDLYQINNLVDSVNLASVRSGFSIGGYDLNQIEGDIVLSIGKPNEPYEGIGRGELNIENLPVLRDRLGAFGSPTSDSERTSVNMETKQFLMIYFGFGALQELNSAADFGEQLLKNFAQAKNIHRFTVV